MATPDIFIELGLIIFLAVLISSIMKLLKQPLIIGYILAGIIASPLFFGLIRSADAFATFSQIGVAFLLFIVGISLSPRALRDVGIISLLIGICQVLLTAILGFLICLALGFPFFASLYISIALTFSSTIIIMKLLSDKNSLDTLYGKISVGLLLVQDFIAILILIAISTFSSGVALPNVILQLAVKGVGLTLLIFLIGYFFFPHLKKFVGDSQEYLFVFSIAWCLACASIFSYAGFSIEIGALLAGVALSVSPFHYEISSRVRPLRDFFIVLFFIFLGSQMTLAGVSDYLAPAIILSLFVLVIKPLIVMLIMGMLGYTKRNGFMVGITSAQISEFSLILVALVVRLGHLGKEILALVTIVGLITIAGSTYMILYADSIYSRLSRYLSFFERKGKKIDEQKPEEKYEYDVVLWGYNRIGFDLLESLKMMKEKFLVIDFNPNTIIELAKEGVPCRYGDASDIELLEELNFKKTRMVVSTIPDLDTNLSLMHTVRKVNKRLIFIVVSHDIDDAKQLYKEGATYVLMPHFLGGKHVADMIESNKFNTEKYLKEKAEHLKNLELRKKKGHEHPTVNRDRK